MDAFQVQYRLILNDFQAFDRYQWKRRSAEKWIFPVGFVLLPVLVALFSSGPAWHNPQRVFESLKSVGPMTILPMVMVIGFYLLLFRRGYANLEKRSPELFEDRVTQISAEYLLNRDSQGERRIFWPAITHIDQDDTHIFLLDKGDNSFIIPKRAFLKETDAALFFQTACRYWKPNEGNPW